MSFNVGMPMLGLKRDTAKGKHAGNMRAIVMEAGEERASATKNLDPSKSELNVHLGMYSKGEDAYSSMMEEIENYESEYKKTSYRGRGLRKDATVACALIVKPEHDWICSQTPEKQERFFADSYEVLQELGIVSEENLRMRERHNDEGSPHEHYVFMAYDEDGKLAGSRVVNLKTFGKLNRDYPKKMQQRGWDMNELQAYDLDAVKEMNPEEAAAYKEKYIEQKAQKIHGLSANEYAAMKQAEEAFEKAKSANELRRDLEDEIADLEPKRTAAHKVIDEAQEDRKKAAEDTLRIWSLAGSLDAAMGNANSHRPPEEVLEDAEEWAEDITKREAETTRKEQQIAKERLAMQKKAQEADELLNDLKSAPKAPTSKESWMVGWIKKHAPEVYAKCESIYKRVMDKHDELMQRKQRIFNDPFIEYGEEIEQKAIQQRKKQRDRQL